MDAESEKISHVKLDDQNTNEQNKMKIKIKEQNETKTRAHTYTATKHTHTQLSSLGATGRRQWHKLRDNCSKLKIIHTVTLFQLSLDLHLILYIDWRLCDNE